MFSVHGALAASLGENRARRIAADFFAAGGCERLSNESALGLAQTSVNSAGECAYYVFNAKDGQGFIIVSANDNIEPVIAYAYDGSFEGNSVPEATASVLLNVKETHRFRKGCLSATQDSCNDSCGVWQQIA